MAKQTRSAALDRATMRSRSDVNARRSIMGTTAGHDARVSSDGRPHPVLLRNEEPVISAFPHQRGVRCRKRSARPKGTGPPLVPYAAASEVLRFAQNDGFEGSNS